MMRVVGRWSLVVGRWSLVVGASAGEGLELSQIWSMQADWAPAMSEE